MLREPAFPASEFEEMKRAALTGAEVAARRALGASPASASRATCSPYPPGHWNYTPTVDERIERHAQGATLEDARRCYRELFGATGAEFVAVGDFDADALTKRGRGAVRRLEEPRALRAHPGAPFRAPAAASTTVRTPDKANAVLRARLQPAACATTIPISRRWSLGNYLLGGSSTARLPARVREKEGLSYSTYTSFSASPLDESASFGVVGDLRAAEPRARRARDPRGARARA